MKKIAFLVVFLWIASISLFAQKYEYTSVQDALQKQGLLNGRGGPSNVIWIRDGAAYSYNFYNYEAKRTEIRVYDVKKDNDELIYDGEGITFPDSDEAFSYNSFQWAADSRHLVFASNFRPIYRRTGISDYYLYDTQEKTMVVMAKDALTAELSPDGKKVGFVRDNDLYVYDLSSKQETRLTTDGAEQKYNGRYGWVYEEEFGLAQAWKWSHDSKYIAFWQQDESDVYELQITDYSGTHAEWMKIPYPKAGDKNPDSKIGVVDIASGNINWLDTGEDLDSYIPRIYWTAETNQLAVMHLNRLQNHMKLFFFDVQSGDKKLIMEDKNESWIDVFDFFAGIMDLMFFPDNLKEFFWVSDSDGFAHIHRYNYEGKLLNKVTSGDWEVTFVNGFDVKGKTIFFTSTEVSPLERHLYSVRFNGKRKKKITDEIGNHSVDVSPNGDYLIDRYSNIDTPRQVVLKDSKGKTIKVLEDNKAVSAHLDSTAYSKKELFSFTTEDGQKLDGYVILPPFFDSTVSHPLVLDIYGGPGAQSVYNSWGSSGWQQYLAQQGYVVASVNNRGSGGYGRDFEKVVYENLGKWEAYDFAETAKYLGSKAWIDEENMAIRGHSYGGYMSGLTLAKFPEVFAAGIVGAPVVDWRLYDSIYTERYMGLPKDNAEGYKNSAVTTYAADLRRPMFLAHSAMDENVHMMNTMQLLTALTSAGKDVDLRIYPPGGHGVAFNGPSYYLLYTSYVEFLGKHLKGLKPIKVN